MKSSQDLKSEVLAQMHQRLELKISDARSAIASVMESRNNDTKSSAGDKYETGRAMMQLEIENNEVQLDNALHQHQELSKITIEKKFTSVAPGSLVITNFETYFISIAMGKIKAGTREVYAISLASPIGLILYHKKAGDEILFNGRKIKIIEIK